MLEIYLPSPILMFLLVFESLNCEWIGLSVNLFWLESSKGPQGKKIERFPSLTIFKISIFFLIFQMYMKDLESAE